MMVDNLPVKEIKCSLEVVVVFADHPPKIKLDTRFQVREIIVYKLSIEHAHTSLFLIVVLFIEFCTHLVFTSCEALTRRMMWLVTTFERLIWHWIRAQQPLSPCVFNEFGWTVTGRASRGLCSVGIINAPTTLFNAPGMTWTSALRFWKAACLRKEGGIIRLP